MKVKTHRYKPAVTGTGRKVTDTTVIKVIGSRTGETFLEKTVSGPERKDFVESKWFTNHAADAILNR